VASLSFFADRTPTTTAEEASSAFLQLSGYRDGGSSSGTGRGTTEWERHSAGDEIVMVIDGETTIWFLAEDGEHPARLGAGDLVVVPQGTWHRFEPPAGAQVLSVTPQPTDHRRDRPA